MASAIDHSEFKYGDKELDTIIQEGIKAYSLRSYEIATEKLGRAYELYMTKFNDDSASLLFIYGKALYKVAVSQSEVLGEKTDVDALGIDEEDREDEGPERAEGNVERHENELENQKEEEEQSDLEVAWEILDLARTLFLEKLEQISDEKEKAMIRNKLAENYDLLGEVSLESENFPQASQDLEESLKLKLELYPKESTLVSEAYFKLSLAHEYNFEDESSKQKAIDSMRNAIESVKLRMEIESGQDDPDLLNDLQIRVSNWTYAYLIKLE